MGHRVLAMMLISFSHLPGDPPLDRLRVPTGADPPNASRGIYNGHMGDRREILYFGPDENTANFMDLGAELAKGRGYPYWKALTTGKSVKLGGVPHDM